MVQYIDTSENSNDIFYLQMRVGKIPLNIMSWGLAEKKDEWTYRGAIVILSRVFDDNLESCEGKEVADAMEDAFELFLKKGGLKREELTKKDKERFARGKPKLKRRFLKRRLRNGCYIDVMESLGVKEEAEMCPWVYQQVIDGVSLGEMYDGRSKSLYGPGERAHDFARVLYHLFWNEKIWSKKKGGPKKFDKYKLRELQGEYEMRFSSPEKNITTKNMVLISPEIEKLDTLLWRG